MGLSNNLSCEAGSLSCCSPQPPQALSIRGLRLYFPKLEPWVARSASLPAVLPGLSVRECGAAGCYPSALPAPFSATLSPALSVYLRECGAAGSASGRTACPVCPTLRQSWSRHGNASPLHPGCPSPPHLLVWMNVYFLFLWCWTSLPFDFLSVLVVRGGAGVSTYAAISVLQAYLKYLLFPDIS